MSIIDQLRDGNFELTFLGSGTARTAVDMNPGLFADVVALDVKQIQRHHRLFQACDAILSVMEPSLIFAGYAQRKTTFYVDSLPFLWRPALGLQALERLKRELLDKPSKAYELAASLPMHDAQALAHYLADACFIQRYSHLDNTIAIPNLHEIGAIVPQYGEHVANEGCDLLVSLSGQLSAFADAASSLDYAHIVIGVCERIQERSGGDLRIDIVVNPAVRELIAPHIQQRFNVCSLDHQQMNEKIRQCSLLLAPPGLTTALESVYHGTPYVLLPDQHYAHHLNRKILDPSSRYALVDFGIEGLPQEPQAATVCLQGRARSLLTSPDYAFVAASAVDRVCSLLLDGKSREAAIRDQRANIDRCVGGFDGARQVTDNVKQAFAFA
ncbi:hypothetical protein [Azohydromonas lata]|uniref:Uncharacterized protein n=1 Tax=Azohydromonas lata TaxID=45677 RepID=A0ABU5ICR5_9BURK|nr:hypothetical protein [Azohydromonas lata]MDZ5456901.1 hypothetical protein [Azohydromonas lata]